MYLILLTTSIVDYIGANWLNCAFVDIFALVKMDILWYYLNVISIINTWALKKSSNTKK
jgi:hypothetical protein